MNKSVCIDINHLIPVVFLHIQKTAGSSIVEVARNYYGESVISHGDYQGHKPDEFQDVPFVSGHFGYEFSRSLIPERYSFTFLRQPVERVLSLYFFCKRSNPDEFKIYRLAKELNLEEFLTLSLEKGYLQTAVCNNQVWQLAHGYGHGTDRDYFSFGEHEKVDLALSHLGKLSHVGFTETFEKDRNIILSNLGIPLPEQNTVINNTADRPSIQDLPDSTVSLLRKATRLDQLIYDQAWANR